MNPVRIRPVVRDDLPKVREMVAALAAHHGDEAEVTVAHLRRDLFGLTPWLKMLVADDGDGPVGYAAMGQRTKIADGLRGMEVEHLYVDPEHRGRGVGRQLLAEAEATVRRLGGDFVSVGTHPSNDAARAIYASLGFEPHPLDPKRFRKRIGVMAAEA